MKKYLVGIIFSLLLVSSVSAKTVQKGDTPLSLWGANWKTEMAKYGINDPHKLPIGLVLGGSNLLGASVPSSPALVDTYLASGISNTDVSMTLASGVTRAGTSLTGYMCFVLDVNTPQVEYTCGTASGTSVTGLLRGVDVSNPNTTSSAQAFSHRRFASVQVSDYPTLQYLVRKMNGVDTIDNFLTYTNANTLPTINGQLVDKYYVDQVGAGGFTAANASTTQGVKVFGTSPETLGINVSTNKGMTIGADGAIYQKASSTAGILQDSNGMYVDPTYVVRQTDATSTPTANKIPIANASGTLSAWINPLGLLFVRAVTSTNKQLVTPTTRTSNSSTYIKIKEAQVMVGGIVNVVWDWKQASGSANNAIIVKNNITTSSPELANGSTSFTSTTQAVYVNPGDFVGLFVKVNIGSNTTTIQNFGLNFDVVTSTNTNTIQD